MKINNFASGMKTKATSDLKLEQIPESGMNLVGE